MNKKWPKNSIVLDAVKRRAMHRFLERALPKPDFDRRVGLLMTMAWSDGYESGRRRRRSSNGQE